jgi:Carboxypeptidase regulatory-like domain
VIEQIDRRLAEWVTAVLGGQAVELSPPGEGGDGSAVSLYLMDLRNAPPARGGNRPPLQVVLRYLVTARAQDPAEGHRLLGELVFAAMEAPEMEVELEPLPVALWRAFGVPPQPAFVLRMPLRRERPEPVVPRVRQPLVLRTEPAISLQGTVVGPGDLPIAGARVELPAVARSTRTDHRGRFAFAGVPASGTRTVRVSAKGREISVTAGTGDGPLLIRLQPMED